MPLYQINNFCLKTSDNRVLKENISLKVERGDFVLITGKNGTGKSTLLKVIEKNFKNDSFLLPQVGEELINLPFVIGDLVSHAGLTQKQLDTPFNLASGGERKKALFYYVLDQNKDILLLDEPFNHLDENSTNEILELMRNALVSKKVSAIFVISHSYIDNIKNTLNERVVELNL